MNLTFIIGVIATFGIVFLSVRQYGAWMILSNVYALTFVIGGVIAANLVGCPFGRLRSATVRALSMLFPSNLPSSEEAILEVSRLAQLAFSGGGILALSNESEEFADGFLHQAIMAAIATGQSQETRRIMEKKVRQLRISAQEDVNVFRTAGTLAPMFGLLGTLLGMMHAMATMSEPAKVGPTMAMALSSAFYGIAVSNLVCLPVSSHMRLRAMQQTLVLEILLEGVLDILASKPPSLIAMHLSSYSQARRQEIETAAPAPTPAPEDAA